MMYPKNAPPDFKLKIKPENAIYNLFLVFIGEGKDIAGFIQSEDAKEWSLFTGIMTDCNIDIFERKIDDEKLSQHYIRYMFTIDDIEGLPYDKPRKGTCYQCGEDEAPIGQVKECLIIKPSLPEK